MSITFRWLIRAGQNSLNWHLVCQPMPADISVTLCTTSVCITALLLPYFCIFLLWDTLTRLNNWSILLMKSLPSSFWHLPRFSLRNPPVPINILRLFQLLSENSPTRSGQRYFNYKMVIFAIIVILFIE